MQEITAFHFNLPFSPAKKALKASARLCHKILGGVDHQHSEALWRVRLVVAFYRLPTLPRLAGITVFTIQPHQPHGDVCGNETS